MTKLTDTDTLVLHRSKLFAGLAEDDLRQVAALCRRRLAPKGQTILAQGEPGESMLVVIFGEVDYVKDKKVVGHDSAGAFFGELSLLGASPGKRAVSVVATDDCVLLELYRPEFEKIVTKYPQTAIVAMQTMAERLRAADPPGLLKSKSNVAIIGVLVAVVAHWLSKHLPKEMANQTATVVVDVCSEYAAPAFAGLAMILKHVEIKTLRKRLFG